MRYPRFIFTAQIGRYWYWPFFLFLSQLYLLGACQLNKLTSAELHDGTGMCQNIHIWLIYIAICLVFNAEYLKGKPVMTFCFKVSAKSCGFMMKIWLSFESLLPPNRHYHFKDKKAIFVSCLILGGKNISNCRPVLMTTMLDSPPVQSQLTWGT